MKNLDLFYRCLDDESNFHVCTRALVSAKRGLRCLLIEHYSQSAGEHQTHTGLQQYSINLKSS